MNASKQLEGAYCKLCKKGTHDLHDHMVTVHYNKPTMFREDLEE